MACAVVVGAPSAHAYTLRSNADCDELRISGAPKVVLHLGSTEGIADPEATVVPAMAAVHGALSHNAGATIQVVEFVTDPSPLTFGAWYGDVEPTVHVGFDPNYPNRATTKRGPKTDCVFGEAHILFESPPSEDWTFDEPGDDYFMVGLDDDQQRTHFRIIYLNQLLKAFGLANNNDDLSVLNHKDRVWSNRPVGERLRLMPDDIAGLSYLYGNGGYAPEVMLLNSWFVPKTNSNATYPAAKQKLMCAPSLGEFGDFDDPTCGDGGTLVAPGDILKARVAVANIWGMGMNLDLRVWFSSDLVLSADDVMSPTEVSVHEGTDKTVLADLAVEVPDGGGLGLGLAYVIIEAVGRVGGGFPIAESIPARGMVTFAAQP